MTNPHRHRPSPEHYEDPPFIGEEGGGGPGDRPAVNNNNPALAKIATDVRVLLSLPLLGQLMIMSPAMNPMERAAAAWDQVDALLAVRRDRRAQHIETMKAEGRFAPRGEQ